MLSDQKVSAIIDRLWEPSGDSEADHVIAADVVVYDSRSGAVSVGAPASGALPACLEALRGMRMSERHRLAGVDGEACILVGSGDFDAAAGLLLVRDGRISRCEMWFRPSPSDTAVGTGA